MLLRSRLSKASFSFPFEAWQIHQYGDVKELKCNQSVRIPSIRNPDDLLVEIHAASVNAIDIKMMQGYGSKLLNLMRRRRYGSNFSLEFPLTLGRDFSGVVVETGKAVTSFNIGDEVWGALSPELQGTHAQYCLVPKTSICRKPSNLSHTEAASLPYAGLTAWSAICLTGLMNARNAAGKRVLVLGGSGGVGTIALQMLKAWGSNTSATSSEDAVPLLLSLGTDNVIDYKSRGYLTDLKTLSSLDFVLDARPENTPDITQHLNPSTGNCTYVTITSPLLRNIDSRGLVLGMVASVGDLSCNIIEKLIDGFSYRWAYFMPSKTGIETLSELVETEKIRPTIDTVIPFEDLPLAYEKALAGHARGKTIIKMK